MGERIWRPAAWSKTYGNLLKVRGQPGWAPGESIPRAGSSATPKGLLRVFITIGGPKAHVNKVGFDIPVLAIDVDALVGRPYQGAEQG